MGHRKKSFLYRICKNKSFVLSIGALGIGMILVVMLPVRIWIVLVGMALIGVSWYCFCK
ncbi:MAG: hypothetical protein N2448_04860 [Caloramator sp.]|nr:hypothetical protein [Caloramator sp.]